MGMTILPVSNAIKSISSSSLTSLKARMTGSSLTGLRPGRISSVLHTTGASAASSAGDVSSVEAAFESSSVNSGLSSAGDAGSMSTTGGADGSGRSSSAATLAVNASVKAIAVVASKRGQCLVEINDLNDE